MKAGFYEKYFPMLFYAGALADALTRGLTLNGEGLYAGGETTRERAENLLRKLSEKYYLRLAINFTREEELTENNKMVATGWELVAPGGMYHTKRMCPFRFSIYGAPKKDGKTPPPDLPADVERMDWYTQSIIDGLIKGELIMYPNVFPTVK